MQAKYPIKVQVIRSKGRTQRLYVALPISLAVAIDMQASEEVQWELISRDELHLVRTTVPDPLAKGRARSH
jgi:hypothetical protein